MSTALATRNGHSENELAISPEDDGFVSYETMEKVVVGGDLSKLSPRERLTWYSGRCKAAGLDPRTQPFQYILLSGKLTLYATKTATDQLISRRHLKVEILERGYVADLGIYEVRCRVTPPDGQSVEDVAALTVMGLKGEAMCNAVMKCVTKAKRRTVLSACGLGMLDETETETIAGAKRIDVDDSGEIVGQVPFGPPQPMQNNSGYGRGQYASPEQTKEFNAKVRSFVERKNTEWLDRWTGPHGMIVDNPGEVMNYFQAIGHLAKWAVETKQLDPSITPETMKGDQASKYIAIIFHRSAGDGKALVKELDRYFNMHAEWKAQAIYREHPDIDPDNDANDADEDYRGDLVDEAGNHVEG